MADEKTEEQLQAAMFQQAAAPEVPPQEAPPEPKPEQPPPAPPPEPLQPPPAAEAAIPSWRLREEAEARRLAEDRARQLEDRLNQVAAHLQQSQKAPDFFENPDAATQAAVMRALQPFAQEYQRAQESQRQERMYNGRLIAETVHGADKVSAAEQAFLNARDKESLDPADYERVVASPNRYDAVVKWHQRQSVFESVGTDPQAWLEQQLEARMNDPQFQAKVLERARTGAAKSPSAVNLPPSLSRVPSAQGNSDRSGDMSDQSLFNFAFREGRK